MSALQDATSSPSLSRAAACHVDDGLDEASVVCSCHATSVPAPAGEIVVLRVAGEVDRSTLGILQDALTESLARGPCALLVDLSGMTFCHGSGLALLVHAARTAAERGTGYAVSAASTHVERVWAILWPEGELPTRHRTAEAGVVAARSRWPDQRETMPALHAGRADHDRTPVGIAASPEGRPVAGAHRP